MRRDSLQTARTSRHLITEILPGKEEVESMVQVLRRRDRLSGAVDVVESEDCVGYSVLHNVTAWTLTTRFWLQQIRRNRMPVASPSPLEKLTTFLVASPIA